MKKLFLLMPALLFLSSCEFWEVDKCLDRGGRWNYEKEVCEFEENADPETSNIDTQSGNPPDVQ